MANIPKSEGAHLSPQRQSDMSTEHVAVRFMKNFKERLQDNPAKYLEILKLLNDYLSKRIGIPEMDMRMKEALNGHRDLLVQFEAFCPYLYKINFNVGKAMDAFLDKVEVYADGNERVLELFSIYLTSYSHKSFPKLYIELMLLFEEDLDLLDDFMQFVPPDRTITFKEFHTWAKEDLHGRVKLLKS